MRIKGSKRKGLRREGITLLGVVLLLAAIGSLNLRRGSATDYFQSDAPVSTEQLAFAQEKHTLPEVLDFFSGQLIFLSVKYDAVQKMPDSIRAILEQRGSEDIRNVTFGNAYAAVIDNGKVVKEKVRSKSSIRLSHRGFEVESGGKDSGGRSRFSHGKNSIEGEKRGLHVYVAQEGRGSIFHFTFDYHQEEAPRSSGLSNQLRLPQLELLTIRLSEKQYQKLLEKREEALKTGILLTSDEDYVPARIGFDEKEYKAVARLKGDWTDHLMEDKWSFRIKLASTDAIMGMRKFSLHHPKTRNYAGEWLFHQLLGEAGLLNLQYHFVQVQLEVAGLGNGSQFLGIYALEEAFDKRVVERNERREGPILRLDEDPLWKERARFYSRNMPLSDLEYVTNTEYANLRILPYGENKVVEDTALLRSFRAGRALFKAYITGELPVSKVFDVEQLAMYNAICNLMGANHALIPHNYRVYYNPITARLEPVGFDANAATKEWYFSIYENAREDTGFQKAYVRALEQVTSPAYIEKALNRPGLMEIVRLLQMEFFDYRWDPGIIRHNANMLRTLLHPENGLNAFLEKQEGDTLVVMLENCSKFPISIRSLQTANNKLIGEPPAPLTVPANGRKAARIPLEANYERLFVNKKKKKARFVLRQDIMDVRLQWSLLGSDKLRSSPIMPWEAHREALAGNDIFRKSPNAKKFDFLVFDEVQKTITCQRGVWQLAEEMIIPPGYTFRAGPGCIIELKNYSGKIISFSPVLFRGKAGEPVEIRSSTGKGQGFIVMETQDTSVLEHCRFTQLSNPTAGDWAISGAVNFYNAPVRISHTLFAENRSEDALNIIHSWFSMEQVAFARTQSDAFDGDFVRGHIQDCLFDMPGNDAIDVSGSDITIDGARIFGAGDKGLSAGESSRIKGRNIEIAESEIAVACKDLSLLELRQARLIKNKVGFTAFQKKAEFGPSTIIASEIEIERNEVLHLIEQGSRLTLNGAEVPVTSNVVNRLYGAEFGKSSK